MILLLTCVTHIKPMKKAIIQYAAKTQIFFFLRLNSSAIDVTTVSTIQSCKKWKEKNEIMIKHLWHWRKSLTLTKPK